MILRIFKSNCFIIIWITIYLATAVTVKIIVKEAFLFSVHVT